MAKKQTSPSGSDSDQEMPDGRFAVEQDDQDNEAEDKNSGEDGPSKAVKKIRKVKHGIIYISSIPKYMTVSILREFLSEQVDIGRVYLQAANGQKGGKDDGNHSLTRILWTSF